VPELGNVGDALRRANMSRKKRKRRQLGSRKTLAALKLDWDAYKFPSRDPYHVPAIPRARHEDTTAKQRVVEPAS
jgi:hypothetical protein